MNIKRFITKTKMKLVLLKFALYKFLGNFITSFKNKFMEFKTERYYNNFKNEFNRILQESEFKKRIELKADFNDVDITPNEKSENSIKSQFTYIIPLYNLMNFNNNLFIHFWSDNNKLHFEFEYVGGISKYILELLTKLNNYLESNINLLDNLFRLYNNSCEEKVLNANYTKHISHLK